MLLKFYYVNWIIESTTQPLTTEHIYMFSGNTPQASSSGGYVPPGGQQPLPRKKPLTGGKPFTRTYLMVVGQPITINYQTYGLMPQTGYG